jgi:hypothetical protein
MYFCIDGSTNEVVFGSRRKRINLPVSFEFSITIEAGTLAVHWYKTVDRHWSIDFPWRPQLVNVVANPIATFDVVDKKWNTRTVTEYEIRELFVPWCIRNLRCLHRYFPWRCSSAVKLNRKKGEYRRVTSVDTWLRKNNLERLSNATRIHSDQSSEKPCSEIR